jgi:hypothetical protein
MDSVSKMSILGVSHHDGIIGTMIQVDFYHYTIKRV